MSAGTLEGGPPRGSAPRGSAPRHGVRRVVRTGDTGGRIPGLDGLRAIAVGAVLVYHFVPAALPGGFLGVDVFFVVSGFLITTLLLREVRREGRVDLVGFWRRRLRRLVPALIALVLVVLPVARLVDRDLTVDAGRQLVGALTFTTNWLEILAGSSYFDQTAPHLLKNLWSLAIEEQFYLVWPLLLVLLVRLTGGARPHARTFAGAVTSLQASARMRAVVSAGVALTSMVLMTVLVTPGEDPTRVYYGTDTHLFGLALGAGLAFVRSAPEGGLLGTERWRRAAPVVSVTALVALGVALVVVREDGLWTYRGAIQLANVAAVLLLASLVTPRSLSGGDPRSEPQLLTWLFERRAVVAVGERSYGLYLWHWPVLVILLQALPTAPGTPARWAALGVALVLTVVASEASLRWVETPVRRHGVRAVLDRVGDTLRLGSLRVRRVTIGALALAAALAVASVAVAATAPKESETAAVIAAKEAEIEAERRLLAAEVAGLGDRSMPSGQDITAYGDSIVVTAKDGLTATFPGIDLNAKSIRRWSDGLTALRADLAQERVRRAVVVDFGTNAGIGDEAQVREFLDLLGPERMVVVVNLQSTSDWVPAVNAQLAGIVEDYPNAIIADWHGAVSERPDLLQSDAIHPDLGGAYLYADVVRESFARLSERMTGEPVELPAGPPWPVGQDGEAR